MAITHSGNVGQTRIRMARLLERSIHGLSVEPRDLWSQIPVYATAHWDCCSWGGWGYLEGVKRSICSWNTMRECLKNGIETLVEPNGIRTYADIEVIAKPSCPKAKPNQER